MPTPKMPNPRQKAVYKYVLSAEDTQKVPLPLGAKPLCVKVQGDKVCMWCLVDPNQTETNRVTVQIAGTGHNRTDLIGEYLDTFMMYNGSLVFHVFIYIPVGRAIRSTNHV